MYNHVSKITSSLKRSYKRKVKNSAYLARFNYTKSTICILNFYDTKLDICSIVMFCQMCTLCGGAQINIDSTDFTNVYLMGILSI